MLGKISLLALLGVLILHGACGGSNSSGSGGSFPVACNSGEFKIQGTLAGQPLALNGSSAGGGYWRGNPAVFSSQASNLATDSSRTKLDLAWTEDSMKDQFAATGTLLMGTGDVLPGKDYCLGSGTLVDFSRDDMRFVLKGLTEGPDCKTAVQADLTGCWN
jgi:hypothetical protein